MAITNTKEFLDLISIDYAAIEERAWAMFKSPTLDEIYAGFKSENYLIMPNKLSVKDLYYHDYKIKIMPQTQTHKRYARRQEMAMVTEIIKALLEGIEKYETQPRSIS